jgi:hypothetical protein
VGWSEGLCIVPVGFCGDKEYINSLCVAILNDIDLTLVRKCLEFSGVVLMQSHGTQTTTLPRVPAAAHRSTNQKRIHFVLTSIPSANQWDSFWGQFRLWCIPEGHDGHLDGGWREHFHEPGEGHGVSWVEFEPGDGEQRAPQTGQHFLE